MFFHKSAKADTFVNFIVPTMDFDAPTKTRVRDGGIESVIAATDRDTFPYHCPSYVGLEMGFG